MLRREIWSLFAFLTLGLAFASPEADAEAEAEAEADPQAVPEAEAQSPYGYGSAPIMGGLNPGMGGGRPPIGSIGIGISCGLMDQCCQAPSEGCCMGENKCYTVWDRKCDYESKPFCRTERKQECIDYPIMGCRMHTQIQPVNVNVTSCKPRSEQKCIPYQTEECEMVDQRQDVTVRWEDQQLTPFNNRTERKCRDVTECRIVETKKTYTKQVPEMKCEDIPRSRNVCKSVLVPGEPKQVTRTVMDSVSKWVCFDIPRTSCTTAPAGPTCPTATCQTGYNVCSATQTQTQNVCGKCENNECDGIDCQQVQIPVCNTGSCAPGPQLPQQCCKTVIEKVWRQQIVKVPRTVTVTVQSEPTYRQQCDTVTETFKQCRTVMVPKTYEVPVKTCRNEMTSKCVEFIVPEQTVTKEQRQEDASFNVKVCNLKTKQAEHCFTAVVGMDCTPSTVSQSVRVTRQLCGRQRVERRCKELPYSSCENTGGQVCRMVPRQVCQNTCSQQTKCNTCSDFVGGGGFGMCNTGNTCNSYIPTDAVQAWGNTANKW